MRIGLTNGRCKRFYDGELPPGNYLLRELPPSKQIFWWQKRPLGSLFTDSTIRSIIQRSLYMKNSTFQERSVLRNGASIFDVFFSHFYFILFLFYLFNMKIKYDVRIYSLTSQASINNTSAEGNRQLRPSPRRGHTIITGWRR